MLQTNGWSVEVLFVERKLILVFLFATSICSIAVIHAKWHVRCAIVESKRIVQLVHQIEQVLTWLTSLDGHARYGDHEHTTQERNKYNRLNIVWDQLLRLIECIHLIFLRKKKNEWCPKLGSKVANRAEEYHPNVVFLWFFFRLSVIKTCFFILYEERVLYYFFLNGMFLSHLYMLHINRFFAVLMWLLYVFACFFLHIITTELKLDPLEALAEW